MPNVRHTPPRRRMTCPTCQRSVSYTLQYCSDPLKQFDAPRILRTHKVNGEVCPGLAGQVILGHGGDE